MRRLQRYGDREAASARVRRVNDSSLPRASYALSRTRFTGTFRFFFQAEQHPQLDFNILIPRRKHINVNLYACTTIREICVSIASCWAPNQTLPRVGGRVGWTLGGLPGNRESETADWNIVLSCPRPHKQESYAAADHVRSVTASRFVYLCFAFPTQSAIAVRRCTYKAMTYNQSRHDVFRGRGKMYGGGP